MRRRMVLATNPDAVRGRTCELAFARIPIRSCSRRGLPCPLPYGRGGGLLLHRFTIACAHSLQTLVWRPRRSRQTVLCGAIPKITLGGRYPPPYPRGARTFLDCALSSIAAAAVRPTGPGHIANHAPRTTGECPATWRTIVVFKGGREMRRACLAAAIVLLGAADAAAQAGRHSWTPADVIGYCTQEGAFGQRFGARSVSRTSPLADGISQIFVPRGRFPPLTEFEAVFTYSSHRLHTLESEARFDTAQQARSAYSALVEAVRESGRFPIAGTLAPGADPDTEIKFYSGDETADFVLSIELFLQGQSSVVLICTDERRKWESLQEFLRSE